MKILFGMKLDGVVWSNKAASMGEVRTGPLGLLSILETKLGISKPSKHPVHRIDEYMNRLKEIDQESNWFHNSFSVDSWSTARQMLEWRDELIEAGWYGNSLEGMSPRLVALADLEKVGIPLSAGHSDGLREVIDCLEKKRLIDIASISTVEPIEMLPPVWQKVIQLLESQGTSVVRWEENVPEETESNLSLIQTVIKNDQKVESGLSASDDSLFLFEADNEWAAAEHLALWLVSKREANEDVSIICGMDTSVLDQALRRHGLPSLGRSERSRWREIQQILPLILANAWEPVDIRLLAELLSLTISILPKWVCNYLLRAISQEPGIGGKAWSEALSIIAEKRKQDLLDKGDKKAEENAEIFVQEIQALLIENRFDPVKGIPEENLRQRCQKVIEWIVKQNDLDPMMTEVVSQAREIQKVSAGKGCIPRIALERMLDTVIGVGSLSEYASEEVAPWHVVDYPGQLVDSRRELIWWGFNDPMAGIPTYWSEEEREVLQAAGVELEKSKDFRNREAFAWRQGLMCAEERFIAVYIAQVDGEESYHHPYWDSILCAAAQTGSSPSEEFAHACILRKCRDLDGKKEWEFAGRKNTLFSVPEVRAVPINPYHVIPQSVIEGPERLSYSQMSTLIGCPMKWALEYHARLRLSESQSIPSGNQMIGTLCHRIIEELYSGRNQLDVSDAVKRVGALYDELIPSMASELLLDGNAIERKRYRAAIIEAVRQLVSSINRLELTVEGLEVSLEAAIHDTPFIGFADVLLRDKEGNPFILDLKWSNSSKYRKQELEEGGSLQLASYAWMMKSADASRKVHAGYFMLAQGQLISDSPLLVDDAIEATYSLDDVWEMGVVSLDNVSEQIDSGMLEASGVKEVMVAKEKNLDDKKVSSAFADEYRGKGMLYQKPPCNFCDFKQLCGLIGGEL